jgi:hypothetical protein
MPNKLKERRIDLPKMQIRADLVPSSFNKEKRTIDVTWGVGKKGLRWSPEIGYFYEELSMDPSHVDMSRLASGNSPFKDNHQYGNDAVIGRVLSAKITNGVGGATVCLMDPAELRNDDAADTIKKVETGFLPNTSIGYNVFQYDRQPIVDGEDIPTYLATNWQPTEISTVPVGFDDEAVVRSKDETKTSCVFINNIPDKIEEVREMDEKEKQRIEQERAAAAEKAQKETAERAAAEARATEKARQVEIRGITEKLGLGEDFAKRMCESDHDIAKVRELAIEEKSKAQPTIRNSNPTVTVSKDASDKWQEGASNWLVQRAGGSVSKAVETHTGKKLEAGEFRGMTLFEMARESLERNGVRTRGMDKMTLVGTAFTHRSAGMNTTSDFAVLLENTMHKVLLANYSVTPDTWRRFCKIGQLSDFRAHPRYRKGSFGALDAKLESGEFKAKSPSDGKKESLTAGTKGNIVTLSREAIVNDDMGVFSELAMDLGRAAKLTVEVDVYALLAQNGGLGPSMNDNNPLFHASHSNIGTGAALSAAGIDGDRVVMASQKDPSGNEILDLRPAILVVPVGLGGQAKVINNSQYDPDTVANKSQMKPNIVVGLFRDVVDTARLSGTRRYLFADPSIAPAIEVGFLDGQENPFLESRDGFSFDGVQWKVRLDYGVGAIDYRGAVTNAGV